MIVRQKIYPTNKTVVSLYYKGFLYLAYCLFTFKSIHLIDISIRCVSIVMYYHFNLRLQNFVLLLLLFSFLSVFRFQIAGGLLVLLNYKYERTIFLLPISLWCE